MQHLSRVKRDPEARNLRQIHLIHAELFADFAAVGFTVGPGNLGENVTTRGLDLLGMSQGTWLRLGDAAVVEVTGLRNPCVQIDRNIGAGAMAATLGVAPDGSLVRKAGVMAVVIEGGDVRPGVAIFILSVPAVKIALRPV